jgi:hypothetical protein
MARSGAQAPNHVLSGLPQRSIAAQETRYSDQPVPVISRSHNILNKQATGRPQDILDAEELEKG